MTAEDAALPGIPLTRRGLGHLLGAAGCALLTAGAAAQSRPFEIRIGYLDRADDAYYKPQRAYAGLAFRERHPPFPGAEVAVKDSAAIGRALGASFSLVRKTLAEEEDAVAGFAALQQDGLTAAILDLSAEDTVAVARAATSSGIAVFNPRHDSNALRLATCGLGLFHTYPSRAMLSDALAQHLARKNWRSVLLLEGPREEDREIADSYARSAQKFGLRVAARRQFVIGNDPRQRDQINVALLTGGADYDAVLLADSEGDFGRYVPYQTLQPRPVLGTEGLVPHAWHWAWERHGAPQLTRRVQRLVGRPMDDADWAAWAAVRAVVEAATRTRAADPRRIAEAMLAEDFALDSYKGAQASFRPWDRQLRQPVLLATHNAVIERAPLDGFLHQTNTLDTLGLDRPEFRCA